MLGTNLETVARRARTMCECVSLESGAEHELRDGRAANSSRQLRIAIDHGVGIHQMLDASRKKVVVPLRSVLEKRVEICGQIDVAISIATVVGERPTGKSTKPVAFLSWHVVGCCPRHWRGSSRWRGQYSLCPYTFWNSARLRVGIAAASQQKPFSPPASPPLLRTLA